MAGLLGAHSARFMFRDDKGSINRQDWWRGMVVLAFILAALVAIAFGLNHFLPRNPAAAEALVDEVAREHTRLMTIPYYLSLFAIDVLYVVMVLVSVCIYFVGAKRYNDLGQPAQLALILPAAAYFQIFSPILSDHLLPVYGRWIVTVAMLAVLAWQVFELGFRKGRL
ncbi:DUF4175 domain-containing protein [Labrys sp. KNU-23]|uniref:DUF4175 domain-containing protein n=1 Tax=Labrys sp. KNU-23 TaxID=2789216 RepID=UPI0011EFE611|nr:DUF4175 domain-containing protein [Labrys sp. KNU-23]QEN88423.1 DUF4175 domain-containing protein [Labrys sp. KNU-23]